MSHPIYRRGDTGPAVAEIRARLELLGLLAPGPATSAADAYRSAAFDDAVDAAVRGFQQSAARTSTASSARRRGGSSTTRAGASATGCCGSHRATR